MEENTNINQQTEPAADGNSTAAANQQTAQPTAQPTFDEMLKNGYQAEFDRRVAKAISTASSKFTDPRVDELQKRLDASERKNAVNAANVDPAFADFVTFTVAGSLAQGETFEAKLEAYLKDNPQYVRQSDAHPQPQAWGQHQTGGADKGEDGVEAAFKRLNPQLKL